MRLVIISIVVSLFVFSCKEKEKIAYYSNNATIPESESLVNDFEDIFTVEQEKSLTQLLSDFEKATTYEIAIVTLTKEMIGNEDSVMFTTTLEIAKTWGVGKKDKDNGVLIGISKGLKNIYIQNGKGTEKVLSNTKTKEIIDTKFIPYFKKGKFYDGTYAGTKAILDFLRDKKIPTK